MGGVARISPTRDVIGPMARDVHDVALLDAVLARGSMAQPAAIDVRGLRLGLPEQHFQESLHADMARVLARVVALLREAGVIFVKADLQNVTALNAAVSFPIVLHETKASLQSFLRESGLGLSLQQLQEAIASPDVKGLVGLAINDHVSKHDYERALSVERPRLQQLYRDYFARHEVEAILFPTTPLPACPIDGSDETVVLRGSPVPTFATFIRNTDPASNAGTPSISLPAGLSAHGLPLGIELDGPAGSDRRLLAIAAAIEAVLNRHSASLEAP
jgi:mandelamide amidase